MAPRDRQGRRVLIIVENLPVPQDKRVRQEARSLVAAGYQVAVISPKGHGSTASHEIVDGVSVFRHPMPFEARGALGYLLEYSWAFVWEVLLAWKVYFKHGFDVVHACNPPDNIFLIALMFRPLGKRFVFDHHDGNLELWLAKGGRKGLVYRALGVFERLSFWLADVSLAVNDHYVGIAKQRGRMPDDSVFLVRNAPARDLVDRTVKEIGRTESVAGERCVVGYLGVLGKQDSVDNLILIAEEIVRKRKREDVEFRIMGDGPELANLKALVSEMSLDEHVKFTGWVSGDDYVRNLSSCALGVNADVANGYNENCSPNKVYEYMLFALPIVQFDMPESKLVAGGGALYARVNDNAHFADRVLELVDDPEKREALGRAGQKRFLESFTWENSEQALLEAYDHVFDL